MSRKRIWDQIQARKRSTKKVKKFRAFKKGAKTIVFEFLNKMNEIELKELSPEAFHFALEHEANALHSELQNLDPNVNIELLWHKSSKAADSLKIEGVRIKWSRWYIGKNPFNDREEVINFTTLFIDGYFDPKT